jgi:predicted nucleic acid-binding protein
MGVIDASVMVSILHPPDVFHGVSRQWFVRHLNAGGTLIAPYLLLSEVAGVISRETRNPDLGLQAIHWLEALPELTLFPVDAALSFQAAEIAASLALRGADAQYVALAAQHGLPLITWDRQQRERSSQRIDAQQPDELLRRLEAIDETLDDTLAERTGLTGDDSTMDDPGFEVHPTSKLGVATREYKAITEAVNQSTAQLEKHTAENNRALLRQAVEQGKQLQQEYKELGERCRYLRLRVGMIQSEIAQIRKHHATAGTPVDEERMQALIRDLQELIGPQG